MDNSTTSTFWNHISLLIQWKKFIVYNVIVVTLITIGVSLVLPEWYKSTASILPPKEQDLLSGLGGAGSLLKGLSGNKSIGGLGKNQGSYNYFAILRSRSAMESVINRFNLITVYDINDKNIEKAIKQLVENTRFETQEEDNITIEVYDKDPQRAADMANYFVDILNDMSIQLGTREARNNREFIESRLEQCKIDLKKAEEALRENQEKSGLIFAADENNSTIAAYAELYALKAKKEIEIGVLERTVTADNAALQQIKVELSELAKKLNTFPKAGIEGLRLYRDVAIQQKIMEFILPLYEQARVDEQKNIPVLLVLDKAVPAHRKTKPQRMLIVAVASVLSLFFSVLLVYIMNSVLIATGGSANMYIEKMKGLVSRIANFYRLKLL